jgi:SAM-dependent methyltransferase
LEQLRTRFTDFEEHEHIAPERLFGVGTDGQYIIFCWSRGGTFYSSDPQPFSPSAVERLLRAIISVGARGSSFTPQALTRDFGSASPTTKKGVQLLYDAISSTSSDRALTFFNQWQLLFGEVCGYDLRSSNDKIRQLGRAYEIDAARAAPLLFAIHTYYAVFIKFLAAEICTSLSPLPLSILQKCRAAPTSAALREEMTSLESGGIWSTIGVKNFLEGDIFSWYLSSWNAQIAECIRDLVNKLDSFDPNTLSVDPDENRDLLKHVYQDLIPKNVRHDLGEYYTPDWLAELTIDTAGYTGDPNLRVLDPGCGSGTFLVVAINKVKAWFAENRHSCGFTERELLQKILRNLVGFDLNPLAVMAARVNVLLSLREYFRYGSTLELPIYLCDSILTPSEYGTLFTGKLGSIRNIKTSVGELTIPSEMTTDPAILSKYSELIEMAVTQEYRAADFIALLLAQGLRIEDKELHLTLFKQLTTLHGTGRDGIWARIIKNAFAPLFLPPVDFILGNPPWINWESLPGEYRDDLKPVWRRYGLFSLDAVGGTHGGGKKDLSMLFVYVCIDKYLKKGGHLGFVITQSLFKTTGAGDGFRSFRFDDFADPDNPQRYYIKPLKVADISRIQVFEGATNRTAMMLVQKTTTAFNYPIEYEIWFGPSRLPQEVSLAEVETKTEQLRVAAFPVMEAKRTSPWLTVPKETHSALRKIIGPSDYQGRAGCTTWMNGVFWVNKISKAPRRGVTIENLHNVGKIKGIKKVTASVEAELVYPLLRGRDVRRWSAIPSAHILLTQDPETRSPISETKMKTSYPRAFAYLSNFKERLKKRSGYKRYYSNKKPAAPFYALYNVGPYTISPWKVLWPEVGHSIRAGVVGPSAESTLPAIPDHTLIFVGCATKEEAHFVCGILNSPMSDLLVRGYIVLHPSPHVLENLAVPRFDPKKDLHKDISRLSVKAHSAYASGKVNDLIQSESELAGKVAGLYGISAEQLDACRSALSSLSGIESAEQNQDDFEDIAAE